MNETVLVVMAKEPRLGSTKTRLCPPLTPSQATGLYEALLMDTISLAAGLGAVDLAVAVTPPESEIYFKRISPPDSLLVPVSCVNIGDCLVQVLGRLLEMGYQRAIALNSDGPSLPASYIKRAVQLLGDHDLVLGPSEDGGYYLVGLKRLHTQIFSDIEWSTKLVTAQTFAKAQQLGLNVAQLPLWYDIDTTNIDSSSSSVMSAAALW